MPFDETISSDVLVIGGGAAGLRAAIEGALNKARVVVVTKSHFPGGSSVMTGGAMQASFGFNSNDTKDNHFRDTVIGGKFLNNQILVRKLVEEAPQRVLDLEKIGVVFERIAPTRYKQMGISGTNIPRNIVAGKYRDVMVVMFDNFTEKGGEMYDQIIITRLLRDSHGSATGAIGLDTRKGKFILFQSKCTILATGGLGGVYSMTTNPRSSTGDGYALALKLGAQINNMEMTQFIPNAYLYPEFTRGMTIGEASIFGPKVKFLNALGERYMKKYDSKRLEFSTRDICARANYIEIRGGRGTPDGGIIIDPRECDPRETIFGIRPDRWRLLRDCYGKSAANLKEPFEAAPSEHFECGGIIINERGETGINALYAAGEVSGGVQGANRLNGNSLAECHVFGKIVGESAVKKARHITQPEVDGKEVEKEWRRVFSILDRNDGVKPFTVERTLRNLMWSKVGIVRNGTEMMEALGELERMKKAWLPNLTVASKTVVYNMEWVKALELDFILDVAESIVRSALFREESRGCHYRTDFPDRNDKTWLKETIVTKSEEEMRIYTQPVKITELYP